MEQSAPTHTLTISVPLNLDANPAAESWDIQEAFRQAVSAILPVTSLGTLGLQCGDVVVEVAHSATECSSTASMSTDRA